MTDSPSKTVSTNDDEPKNLEMLRISSRKAHTIPKSELQALDDKAKELKTSKAPCTEDCSTIQKESTPASTCPQFLTLPIEIRYQIYGYTGTPTSGVINLKTPDGKPNLAITLIIKQIRDESLYILHNDIPLDLDFWNYPERKQKIRELAAIRESKYKFFWQRYLKPHREEITHEILTWHINMTEYEKTHAIKLDPGLVARFRDITLHFSIDRDIFRNPALGDGVATWLRQLWNLMPSTSHQQRRLVLDWKYDCTGYAFRYD